MNDPTITPPRSALNNNEKLFEEDLETHAPSPNDRSADVLKITLIQLK